MADALLCFIIFLVIPGFCSEVGVENSSWRLVWGILGLIFFLSAGMLALADIVNWWAQLP